MSELEQRPRLVEQERLGLEEQCLELTEEQRRLEAEIASKPAVVASFVVPKPTLQVVVDQLPKHPVLRYDHRGHGGSAKPPGPYTLDALVEDAARLIREWGRGPVVFVGLSMGGMVAQGLAIRHPDLVRGVVLANTTAQYPEAAQAAWDARIAALKAGGMARIAEMVVERYLHADFRAAHPEFTAALHAQLLRADAAGYLATCQAIRAVDWLPSLVRVKCPTLVLSGARDVGYSRYDPSWMENFDCVCVEADRCPRCASPNLKELERCSECGWTVTNPAGIADSPECLCHLEGD